MVKVSIAVCTLVMLLCCGGNDLAVNNIGWQFPEHLPEVVVPNDNQITAVRVDLGRKLFFDRNISLDSSVACVDCHLPNYALADTTPLSDGVDGLLGLRNAPSLYNAAYLGPINKDGGVRTLDLQALVPIEDEHEMALPVLQLQRRLEEDESYAHLADLAYGRLPDAYAITRSLATFVRTLVSADSPYDRYLEGDSAALSEQAMEGLSLFTSQRLGCADCHSGPLLTDNGFANNGLYVKYKDVGRALITMDSTDAGQFRIPSLRNVALTAPYMHDGSLGSLEEVIDHYAEKAFLPGKRPDHRLRPFQLSTAEKAALMAFLKCLTGDSADKPI